MDQRQLYSLYDSDSAPIVAFLDHLRETFGLPDHASVLDMGCGPGRMLRPLAQAGWIVTGYEPDPDYAISAREVAGAIPGATFRQAGLLDLKEDSAFDLIALINGPLSYILDPGGRREALDRCRAALRPRGVLFLDLANSPWILKNYREPPQLKLELEGTKVIRTARHEIDYHKGHFTHHDHFEWQGPGGEVRSLDKTHRMGMVGFPEIEYFLGELGFTEISTYNSFEDRGPATLLGKRIMVAARRGSA